MKRFNWLAAGATAVALAAGGCATQPSEPYYGSTQNSPGPYSSNASYGQGVVDRIEVVNRSAGNNIAGTIIGGIAGGLIGHQIGGGSGNTAATIAGAAGGAYAGNQIQNRTRTQNETFRVTVRMDNGGTQVIRQDDISDLRTGDRVRVENNRLYRL